MSSFVICSKLSHLFNKIDPICANYCLLVLSRQLYGRIKDVVVPEMFMNETTRKVLVMQWVEVLLHNSF